MLEKYEPQEIELAAQAQWNKTGAARAIGITCAQLAHQIAGIDAHRAALGA